MTLNDRTKQYYVEALEHLLKIKSFEKIQIKDLCEYCKTTRTTFYYHFHDKYDLVAWIFNQDYQSVFFEDNANMSKETAIHLLNKMYNKKSFYKKVFTDHSQNSIFNYIHNFNINNGIRVVKFTYNIDKLSNTQLYLITHFSYGTLLMLIDWLLEKYKMSANELINLQYELMPDFLEHAYTYYFENY